MEDNLKKFFFKERDINKKLDKYNLDTLFGEGLNTQVNIIITKLLDRGTVDKDVLISKVLERMNKIDDLVTLSICIREGCKVNNIELIKDKNIRKAVRDLIDVNNNKRNINSNKLFLYNILLNKNEAFTDLNNDDYHNIIISGSSLFTINSKDINLLKLSYRSYNYKRFVEFIDNGVFPDYVMLNDIVINISVTSGLPRLELIRMIKYLIFKNIKLDKYQCEILMSRNKLDYYINNSLVIKNIDRQIQYLYNNEDLIFFVVMKENMVLEGLTYQEPVIISDKLLDMIISKSESIMEELIGNKIIKKPVYTYGTGVKLSDEHSYITLCRMVINCYRNNNLNRIKEMLDDIS